LKSTQIDHEEEPGMKRYVDVHAAPDGDGTQEHPYQRIQQAADVAQAGDEILVMPGIYRER
jgi:hypothetical protein